MKYYRLTLLVLLITALSACKLFESDESHRMSSSLERDHGMDHDDMIRSISDFIYLMIPHHEEAIIRSSILIKEMTVLKDGKMVTSGYNDLTGVQFLASSIVNTQSMELAMMKKRLSDFYSGVIYTGVIYIPMMRDTTTIEDPLVKERMYLEDMIIHHQGAIDMANKLLRVIERDNRIADFDENIEDFRIKLRSFAEDIITIQTKEINDMMELLDNGY